VAERTPEEEGTAAAVAYREALSMIMAFDLDGLDGCGRILMSSTVPPGELIIALASIAAKLMQLMADASGRTTSEVIAAAQAMVNKTQEDGDLYQ